MGGFFSALASLLGITQMMMKWRERKADRDAGARDQQLRSKTDERLAESSARRTDISKSGTSSSVALPACCSRASPISPRYSTIFAGFREITGDFTDDAIAGLFHDNAVRIYRLDRQDEQSAETGA